MRKNVRYLVFAALVTILPGEIFCQKILNPEYSPPDVRFDNFLINRGEASQESISILIDRKGFFWSGTGTGLYRFDGIRYVAYGVKRGDNEGFAGFIVTNIFEDSEGTIWVGTSEALNKLDQKTETFKSYFPDSTQKGGISNYIRAIREDRDSMLWILTKKDIFSFDKKNEKFNRYAVDSLSWIPENSLPIVADECFAQDRQGNKWFVTRRGLYLYHNQNKTFTMVLPDSGTNELKDVNNVNCVTADNDGTIWIGTSGCGLLRWNKDQNKPDRIKIQPAGQNSNLFNEVTSIHIDKNGTVWAFGNGSFSNYNPVNNSIKNYIIPRKPRTVFMSPDSKVLIGQAFQYNDGTLWFLNKSEGLMFRFEPATEKLSVYFVPAFIVYQCIMDNTGSFWFSCIRFNIYRLVTGNIPYMTIQVRNGSHVAQVHYGSIMEDNKKRVWFFFDSGVYTCKDFDITSSFVPDQVRFMGDDRAIRGGLCDSRGNIWICSTDGSVVRYDPIKDTYRILTPHYPPDQAEQRFFPLISEDKEGNIWIATIQNGLYKFDKPGNKFVHVLDFTDKSGSKEHKSILDFFIDSRDNFWIIGETLLSIKMPELKIVDYTDSSQVKFNLMGTNIRVCEDSKGNLFILNGISGVLKYSRLDGSFTKINVINEYFDTEYFDLLIDRRDRLWIAHNRGITIYSPQDGNSRMIKTPRLQFDVQAYQLKSGQIIYINENRLYVFDEDVPSNSFTPPVYLTRLLVNGIEYNKIEGNSSDINTLTRLDLPCRRNNLNFEFAALNYLNPHENMYRFYMTGMDEDTITAGPGFPAEYKQMAPGRYKFWITGSNNDGLWNPTGVTVDIRIHPPWNRSVLAYIVYILAFVSLIIGYIRLRTYRLTRDKIRLKAEIEEATKELKIKNRQLAEIDRIKTHFFTDISHEIRTPLSLILGPLEIMEKEEMLSSRMTGMIDLMKRNSQRLMHLVNQLLDISRLDAGKMKITLAEEDIVKCLRILVYEFLSMAESKHIKYMADLPEKSFKTWFDRDKIEKIISNLLTNAFKYTPQKGEVHCIVRIESDGNKNLPPLLKVRVIDSGPGISDEHQPRIFDRFYRIEGGHGTGIGLSLVQEFISLLKGEIKVNSIQGKGSDFSITIPLGKDHLSMEEYVLMESPSGIVDKQLVTNLKHQVDSGRIKRDQESKERLLIIEDNNDLRKFIGDSLKEKFNILEAENGKTGINIAFTMMPDLIVTDIMMPDLDGIQLCNKLKNDERTSHIPVIMLTAKATTDDRVAGLRSGADDYIIKPFNMSELIVRISNLLVLREKLKLKYNRFYSLHAGKEISRSVDDRFLYKVLGIINKNLRDFSFDVGNLVEHLGMSRTHLTRKLKVLTGLTPGTLIRNIRLEKAAELLLNKGGNVTEVANSVGISNPSSFTKSFRNYFGVSPKDYANH